MALRKLLIVLFAFLGSIQGLVAQDVEEARPESSLFDDFMRADGKVAVTIIVVSIILAGMVAYLVNTDRKVRALENELGEE